MDFNKNSDFVENSVKIIKINVPSSFKSHWIDEIQVGFGQQRKGNAMLLGG
ncbi:hypothetical protein ACFSKL_17400 [Belliella marina]|uniref:Uncharacterized protein n=1 Tax=Belliella marina TaxID=1644146 RepID=A0ABW4VUP3_9BACT